MSKITNHDGSWGTASASEPVARKLLRAANKGPLGNQTANNPLWYDDDTTLQTKTVNVTGTSERRRAGR